MLLGALLWLLGRLCHLLPNLVAGWHVDDAVFVPEEEAVLEELLHMGLGFIDLVEIATGSSCLLLHLLEASHPCRNLCFPLLLKELFLLDLSLGLSPDCGGLHQVARLALGDCRKGFEGQRGTYLRWRWTAGRYARSPGPWR